MAVYKRNKIWYVYYYVKVNGRQKKKGVAVGPRKDIAEALDKKYREMVKSGIDTSVVHTNTKLDDLPVTALDSSSILVPQGLTLEEFKPIFLELHGNSLSKKMLESYETSLAHLIPIFGNVCLDSISKVTVKTYMVNRKNEGVCNTTVNKEIRCLTKALSMAFEWGYIEQSPLKGLKLLKEPPERIRYLIKDEYERLLKVSPQYLRDIIVFATGTGMRKSEIFNLTWDSVTFSETSRYGQITVLGKGDKRRHLSMNKTVYDLLIRLNRVREGKFIFPSPKTGERITDVKKSFKTALKNADIEDFRFHDLRHTFASWLVMKGVNLYTVQKLLGHTSITTTQRYAHLAPGYLEREIGKIDDYIATENESSEESIMEIDKVAISCP